MKTERLRRRKGRRSAGPSHRLRWDAVKMGVRTEKDAVRIDEIMFHQCEWTSTVSNCHHRKYSFENYFKNGGTLPHQDLKITAKRVYWAMVVQWIVIDP